MTSTFARSVWCPALAAMNRRTLSPLAPRDECRSSMGPIEVPSTAVQAIRRVILQDHLSNDDYQVLIDLEVHSLVVEVVFPGISIGMLVKW